MERRIRSKRTVIEGLALAAGLLASVGPAVAAMALVAPEMKEGARLPMAQVGTRGGCHGLDRTPALSWSGVPARAHSLALTLFDPDAAAGRGFWHWALLDLSTKQHGWPAGQRATGEIRAGRNDFGTVGYAGACPPPGPPHRYVFTLWALPERRAPFGTGTADAAIAVYLRTHALARASLTVRYGR